MQTPAYFQGLSKHGMIFDEHPLAKLWFKITHSQKNYSTLPKYT